jgi:hypothetical protein
MEEKSSATGASNMNAATKRDVMRDVLERLFQELAK